MIQERISSNVFSRFQQERETRDPIRRRLCAMSWAASSCERSTRTTYTKTDSSVEYAITSKQDEGRSGGIFFINDRFGDPDISTVMMIPTRSLDRDLDRSRTSLDIEYLVSFKTVIREVIKKKQPIVVQPSLYKRPLASDFLQCTKIQIVQ